MYNVGNLQMQYIVIMMARDIGGGNGAASTAIASTTLEPARAELYQCLSYITQETGILLYSLVKYSCIVVYPLIVCYLGDRHIRTTSQLQDGPHTVTITCR